MRRVAWSASSAEQRMSSKVYDWTQPTSPPPASPPGQAVGSASTMAGACEQPPPAGSREHPFPPAASHPHAAAGDGKNPAAEAFGRIKGDVDELKAYAGHYVAAKIDGIKRT